MIKEVLNILKETYPEATCSLEFNNPLQLLISTILSAQCTDERVNIVTKDLFIKYTTVKDYANADIKELESIIRPTGFYHNKAKNIINCCKKIINDYNGSIPDNMDDLVSLSGVGRKVANVVLQSAFGKNVGVVVDTHCKRLSFRLGFTKSDNPEKIEQELIKIVPKDDWSVYGHLMVFHGRAVCTARNPKCEDCPINHLCPKIGIQQKKKQ